MAEVLATLLWKPDPQSIKLQALDLENGQTLNTILPHLFNAFIDIQNYIPSLSKGVPYHDFCLGTRPMMLYVSRLLIKNNTVTHRPLTQNMGQLWLCPCCGKQTSLPGKATSAHHKLKAITAFNTCYNPENFDYSFKELS